MRGNFCLIYAFKNLFGIKIHLCESGTSRPASPIWGNSRILYGDKRILWILLQPGRVNRKSPGDEPLWSAVFEKKGEINSKREDYQQRNPVPNHAPPVTPGKLQDFLGLKSTSLSPHTNHGVKLRINPLFFTFWLISTLGQHRLRLSRSGRRRSQREIWAFCWSGAAKQIINDNTKNSTCTRKRFPRA